MKIKLIFVFATVFLLLVFFVSGVLAAGSIERVSVASDDTQGNGESWYPSISSDGRYVAFDSFANNIVPNDINGKRDIFIRDQMANTTTLVSICIPTDNCNAPHAYGHSYYPSISGDGRYIAFISYAPNLVPDDTNRKRDIFIRDRQTSTTTRASVSDNGTPGNDESFSPSISDDGRYVAFQSFANSLVSNDTNGKGDIFVRDRKANTTKRISVSDNATQGNNSSLYPRISGDGRYVVFLSHASNLVPNDMNGFQDTFIHDLHTNITTIVSVSDNGTPGNNYSNTHDINNDGRYVAFQSYASNLVPNDTNGYVSDIFVRDRQTNTISIVSVSDNGTQGNGESWNPSISGDGRYIAFQSHASNLVPNDTNRKMDIFIRDRQTNTTARVSVASDGSEANDENRYPSISGDGRYIAFQSHASNLVPNDTNGLCDIFVAENPLYESPPPQPPSDTPPVPQQTPRASPTPPRPLNPAQLSAQYVSVNPQLAGANQPVTITTNVVNTGDEGGNYNVALKINGHVEQTRMVSVGAHGTQPVKFTVTKAQPGTYDIDIGGQKGSFTIAGQTGSTAGKSASGGLIAILIFSVLILITIVLLIRRPAQ